MDGHVLRFVIIVGTMLHYGSSLGMWLQSSEHDGFSTGKRFTLESMPVTKQPGA